MKKIICETKEEIKEELGSKTYLEHFIEDRKSYAILMAEEDLEFTRNLDKKGKAVMDFSFTLIDTESGIDYVFAFGVVGNSLDHLKDISELRGSVGGNIGIMASAMEKEYGVHDTSFASQTEIYGFSSYEIESEKFIEVMEKWKEFFKKNGYGCGAIYIRNAINSA